MLAHATWLEQTSILYIDVNTGVTQSYLMFSIGEEFEEEKKETYLYETLGGNHSRAALQALCEEMKNPPAAFRTRLVSVYFGLTDEEAYRLASKHNNATSLQHRMSHWEKVKAVIAILKLVLIQTYRFCFVEVHCFG